MVSSARFSLVVIDGPTPGQIFELTKTNVVLGRDPGQNLDVLIPSPTVSRRHATLMRKDAQWFIQDLGSANGTSLNGERLSAEPRAIRPGDRIQLGGAVSLLFKVDADSEAPRVGQVPPVAAGTTIVGEDLVLPVQAAPPTLTVSVAGSELMIYTLTKDVYTIGRDAQSDIVINSALVSRRHARLERMGPGYKLVSLPEAKNPVLYAGQPISGTHRLRHNDVMRIGRVDPHLIVTMAYSSPAEAEIARGVSTIRFGDKSVIQIGRDPTCDVVLSAPTVSRFHAQVERIGRRYRLRDLRSSNGTFVNDEPIDGDVWLNPHDTVRIGAYRFVMGEDTLEQHDETSGLRADAVNLNKWVRRGLNILQNISVVFQPREMIVIVGQSGGGKSTLLDAIAGYRPSTHGRVYVNDIDIYKNFDAIRNSIGYVPQRDIIHYELTAYEALDYAARLRMPPDTTRDERHKRVMEVLEELDLAHRKDVRVSGLSGGQQKRVSIGVELLTRPGLFFLDEATSGLDPGTETALMQLLRRLADQGRTIVLVTHATKNVMLADKVVFMARGGYLAWFGPPDEALAFFDQYRSEKDRRTAEMEFDKIYAVLDDPSKGKPLEWAERYKKTAAYQRYILQPLAEKRLAADQAQRVPLARAAAPARAAKAPKARRQVSALRQFFILSSRNLKILTRDRTSMVLMLTAAPLVSMLDVLVAFMMGRDMFDFTAGSTENITMSFFLLIIFAVFVGALSQMREIVKENDIYRRERLVNLKIFPYVFSKVWFAGLLALYHAVAYVGIHYLAYDMPGGRLEFGLMYVTTFLLAFSGMMLGLFTSALATSANTAPMLVILLLMPQVVLSGALVTLPGNVSAPAVTRWAFETYMGVSGVGSDVAADLCWQLPEDLRSAMTIDERTEKCRCMGTNVLRVESCNFPGVGKYYDEVINQPAPVEPTELRDRPPEPTIPPAPTQPADTSDNVAMAEYFEALQDYQDETDTIRDNYRAEMDAYEAEADVYEAAMTAYQEEKVDWEVKRAAAVEAAEKLIDRFYDKFGWTFVDKDNPDAFWSKTFTAWIAEVVIIAVLIVGVLILVKRKDVVK